MPGGKVRLDRAISKLGLASRAEARKLIAAGKVTVAGTVALDAAALVVPETAKLVVDGRRPSAKPWRLIAFHKPRGVITTRRDPEGRRTVFDVLGDVGADLVTVGRLDRASTGLLLLTTDTKLADALTDPGNAIVRRYVVTVRGAVTDDAVAAMTQGIDGLRAHAMEIRKRSNRETHLIVALTEGKNREVRRLLAATGHEVTKLMRVAFGAIELDTLQPGEWRDVARADVHATLEGAPSRSARRPRVKSKGYNPSR